MNKQELGSNELFFSTEQLLSVDVRTTTSSLNRRAESDLSDYASVERSHSWPTLINTNSTRRKSSSPSSTTVACTRNMTKTTGLRTRSLSLSAANKDIRDAIVLSGRLRSPDNFSLPLVLCSKCLKLARVTEAASTESSNRSLHRYTTYPSELPLPADYVIKNPVGHNSKSRCWPCSNCGSVVELKVKQRSPSKTRPAHHHDKQGRRKGKLRRRLSKMHQVLRSTLGVTPELPEQAAIKDLTENQSPVTTNSVSPSHSRSNSGTSRSSPSNDNSDYEQCDVVEYNDANGQYLVLQPRSITEEEAEARSTPDSSKSQPFNNVQGIEPTSRDSPVSNTDGDMSESMASRDNASVTSLPTSLAGETRLTSTPLGRSSKQHSTSSSPVRRHNSTASQWSKSSSASGFTTSGSYSQSYHRGHESGSINGYSTAPNLHAYQPRSVPVSEMAVSYKSDAGTLFLSLPETTLDKKSPGYGKHGMRKKKRSASWYNVLSPSYKQKNDDFHKFFKQLPETERLLVDYACALVKDILVQGRMYVSQNYVCFHSNILKWQTVVMQSFKDINAITKEKTVKVIPNAIQFQVKGRDKPQTFTSFTQRDRAFQEIFRLWQNALLDKPMTPHELWSSVHNQYGSDLGCSSDDDYVKPRLKFAFANDSPTAEVYEFGTTKKVKRKKKHGQAHHSTSDDFNSTSHGRLDSERLESIVDQSSENEKSSSRESMEEQEFESLEDRGCEACETGLLDEDDEPASHAYEDLRRVYVLREFNVPASTMFRTIYGDDCPFWTNYLVGKGSYDVVVGKWQDGTGDNEGHKVKYLDYNLALTNPLGPKSSKVDEIQVCYKDTQPGRYYTVDCTARTHGVPYADYFSTIMRYCIRKVDRTTCELKVSAQLKFYKNPWGPIKSFIEKNAYSGIEENFILLERELVKYFASNGHGQSPVAVQRSSVSSTGARRRKSTNTTSSSSEIQNTDAVDYPLSNGHLPSQSKSGATDMKAAPSTTPLAVPSRDINNNNKEHVFADRRKGGKWLSRLAVLAFCLLLLSNYSMYQRLNSLEILHSRVSSTPGAISAVSSDSLYGVESHDDVTIAKGLQNLERRLARLENVVQTHVTSSETRWTEMASDWKALHHTIDRILEQIHSNAKS